MRPDGPLIAIVGRPNVGKSTLFNRLVGGRPALVHDTPGLTRDRRYGEIDYYGHHFRIVDTGGLDPDAEKEVIGAGIHRQARAALDEAAAVILVVDGTAGVTPLDQEVVRLVRKLDKPTMVAANKLDSLKRETRHMPDLYELGVGEIFPISAIHGRGIDDIFDRLVEVLEPERHLDDDEEEETEGGPVRVAFVGKPNAGKSSMVNRLLGTERVLVHDVAGTTTDPVDTPFELDGQQYILSIPPGFAARSAAAAISRSFRWRWRAARFAAPMWWCLWSTPQTGRASKTPALAVSSKRTAARWW
ncbi:MAG: 50S ribosome-binding GTPase [Deltaproteobacteria bacterium]|nr:50S ribosome-binding GTPase [Deltaproteobacteria bacterium]